MLTALVTGCDRGIGKAVALQLAARAAKVVAVCLEDSAELRNRGLDVVAHVDVTSDAAVDRLAGELGRRDVKLDWLLNVAGVLGVDELGKIDFADVRRQFEINAIGPLRVVQSLRDRLASGSKVGIVTSRVGSLGDNGSGGMYAYRMSKVAANMAGLNLHHDLSKRGIAVILMHPGMVDTDLTKMLPRTTAFITPEQAAAGLIRNMDELTLATSGRFRHANGEYLPW
jgi:NAD(P)-dependent dehydrogenase (short-subunit alcohol dehydrogenase family)